MASYAVESGRQPMVATGIVDTVVEWEDKPGGGRRPSELQARDERSGMPLWGVEVMYPQTAFGRTSTAIAKVTVGAIDRPTPGLYAPVVFVGLEVEVRTNKAGGFGESWRAEALADGSAGSKPVSAAKPAA